MAAKKERDPIGFDPFAWVDRLADVNDGSAFPAEAKAIIESGLITLRERLRRWKDGG